MEPRLPTPSPSPEMGNYRRPEVVRVPENVPTEKREAAAGQAERRESEPQTSQSAVPVAPIISQLPLPVATPQLQPAAHQPVVDDSPLVANDDDLIEKEWVAKAKQIVQETKADPYRQENEVSRLQADYLKKRYGKDVQLNN